VTRRRAARDQLNQEAWLERALEVLRDEGIQGVRVERLARDLGVTKGSFYWHFSDREELFRGILDYWSKLYNDVIIDNPEFSKDPPSEGLLSAVTKVRHDGLDKYEMAIRAWASHDAEVDRVVREVYARRKKFVKGLFLKIGFSTTEAEVRTRLMLCYLSWEPNMYPDESAAKRLQLLKLQHALLTRS
jgi:AcrR family transcriptional regulator